MKYKAYICSIDMSLEGHESEPDKLIYDGDSFLDLEQTILDNDAEVGADVDLYFLINDVSVSDWREFQQDKLIIKQRANDLE